MIGFNEYQAQAYSTALPKSRNATYMCLGLANEAGEVAGKLKKMFRGDTTYDGVRDAIKQELGDTLWYLAGMAQQFDLSLSEVAEANIKKLHDRQLRGKIQGDGDNR